MIKWVDKPTRMQRGRHSFCVKQGLEEFNSYCGVEFSAFDPMNRNFPIDHPCDFNVKAQSVTICWWGSYSSDGIGPDYEYFKGRYKRLNPIPINGIWIGGNQVTKDLVKARRMILIPAYYQLCTKVLNANYDWYRVLLKMKASPIQFELYDGYDNTNIEDLFKVSCAWLLVNYIHLLI